RHQGARARYRDLILCDGDRHLALPAVARIRGQVSHRIAVPLLSALPPPEPQRLLLPDNGVRGDRATAPPCCGRRTMAPAPSADVARDVAPLLDHRAGGLLRAVP